MPFIEQESKDEIQTINGEKVRILTPEVEVTLTNTETGQEYMSDKEADDDVDHPETVTKREHIKRDVHIKVKQVVLGAQTKGL
jgi:hypothetical protein|tara:strand:+ start:189 stop:437 length:249 start_codon:yes stop_codon:yes gene_type:complete